MSRGVGRRRGSDPVLLWLWHRPVSTAPIGPLAWESPYAAGAALEKDKKKKKVRKKKAGWVQLTHLRNPTPTISSSLPSEGFHSNEEFPYVICTIIIL